MQLDEQEERRRFLNEKRSRRLTWRIFICINDCRNEMRRTNRKRNDVRNENDEKATRRKIGRKSPVISVNRFNALSCDSVATTRWLDVATAVTVTHGMENETRKFRQRDVANLISRLVAIRTTRAISWSRSVERSQVHRSTLMIRIGDPVSVATSGPSLLPPLTHASSTMH